MITKIVSALIPLSFATLTWAQPIELNKATEVELDALKGVGPALTKEVMNERQKTPFTDWPNVLQRVKGIGPKKAVSLSEQGVQVQGQGFDRPTAHSLQKR